jgi:hypothetical protein
MTDQWGETQDGSLAQALTASHRAIERVRRYKLQAVTTPPTAAKGGFPYQHPTCAEVLPRHKPNFKTAQRVTPISRRVGEADTPFASRIFHGEA